MNAYVKMKICKNEKRMLNPLCNANMKKDYISVKKLYEAQKKWR